MDLTIKLPHKNHDKTQITDRLIWHFKGYNIIINIQGKRTFKNLVTADLAPFTKWTYMYI